MGFNFADSIIWYCKEWGMWTLLSPILLYFLDTTFRSISVWVTRISAVTVFLLAIFTARLAFNSGEYPDDISSALVYLVPKYTSGLVILLGIWLFVRHPDTLPLSSVKPAEDKISATIIIEHNGLNIQLRLADIISIKTAGNYVEIDTDNQTYLTRTTLKALLAELPQAYFQQVHRSFVINISKLQKLTHLENGGGKAILSNQQCIPVSKRYKSQLKSMVMSDLHPSV